MSHDSKQKWKEWYSFYFRFDEENKTLSKMERYYCSMLSNYHNILFSLSYYDISEPL